MKGVTSLFDLSINRFTGMLPDRGMRALTAAKLFYVYTNQFEGSLPESISVMTNMKVFVASTNRLTGMLPGGIRAMRAVRHLRLHENGFT
eukprot:4893209-Amphidinium_carterae.1